MSPACGTQNISVVSGAPPMCNVRGGPGTFVITAEVFSANILTTIRCAHLGARPMDCKMP